MGLIIGANDLPEPKKGLPRPEVDLPHPNAVPAGQRAQDAASLSRWLRGPQPVLRSWAVEWSRRDGSAALVPDLVALIADEDLMVAAGAVFELDRRRAPEAVEAMVARFKTASDALGAALAEALGHLAPERLLEAVQGRGRLDDVTYGGAMMALATSGLPEAHAYLDRALGRSGALEGRRKASLFNAALVSGNLALVGRVLGYALADSQAEDPEEGALSSRVAVAGAAAVVFAVARREHGGVLFDQQRKLVEQAIVPALPEAERDRLEDALRKKNSGEILEALGHFLNRSGPTEGEAGRSYNRRRALLEALVERRAVVAALPADAAALFLALASTSVTLLLGADPVHADKSGYETVSKALDGVLSPEALSGASLDALVALLKEKSPRELRRVVSALVRSRFYAEGFVGRFMEALLVAGHGVALIEAVAEVEDEAPRGRLREVCDRQVEAAEAAVMEVLMAQPLDEKVVPTALFLTEGLATQRLGVVVMRRFWALRPLARDLVARVLLRVGDVRALPLLESRNFAGEPEEMAWVVLALLAEQPLVGTLAEALNRVESVEESDELRIPLSCNHCEETLTYSFERVLLDPEPKTPDGDPAFVGSVRCKACGTDDALALTPWAAQALTMEMMAFLEQAKAGKVESDPRVMPGQTVVAGQKVGFAEALRLAKKAAAASPESMRAQLHLARLLVTLRRDGASEVVAAARALDPGSPEVMVLGAALAMRRGAVDEAAAEASEALRRLSQNPRLYGEEDPQALKGMLQSYLSELGVQA